MPLSLAEFQKDRRPIRAIYYAQTINAVYRPQRYTIGLAQEYGTKPVIELIEELVESWDITDTGTGDDFWEEVGGRACDECGQHGTWPIDAEHLTKLPLRLLSEISVEILRDVRQGEAESSSVDGSPLAAKSESSPTGTDS